MSLMETLSSTMETVEDGSNTGGGAKKLALTRPKLTLHPRNATEAFLRGSDAATPSPMTFVASLFADQDPYTGDQKSFSQLLAGAMASPNATISAQNDSTTSITLPSLAESSTPLGGGGPCSDGLPPRANTARFKSMMPPRLPIPRSPYLLIPPGFSPSTILESPVLLSTSLAEPSPTTGTFRPPFTQDSVLTAGPNVPGNFKDWNFGQDGNIASIFKPYPQLPNSPLASMGPYGLSHQQALAHVQAQANSQLMFDVAGPVASACDTTSNMPSTAVDTFIETNVSSQSLSLCEPKKETELELSEKLSSVSQSIGSGHPPTHFIERPAEDGYNWRKYGQKQVKGSEYPRSYYKCTHPNCPVKKKVERSYDGQITEIVYKGEHSHAKPQSTRRHHAINIAHVSDGPMKEGSFLPTLDRANFPSGMSRADRTQPAGRLTGTPEASLASTSDDEEGRDDESDPKRLKHERGTEPISNPPLRTIREPRVVVQTTSEVDILDDGYRWRKYGQKVVKGNPYPRLVFFDVIIIFHLSRF
ncbi:hypothetical protein KP509_13G001000 [Ceratopteris richardii]|uniref:WRKY domain-containing protein n=1 Tax=Ceratopteris richardii TaxID=49495 RepID=A0A8T2TAR1_CERRI|nr:hypothetical protein KP509_13G001000 [Ceratopteris richardii]KAH7420303.1 hypothetical protein KP509_13G001000 [Ceratopteris richardii]